MRRLAGKLAELTSVSAEDFQNKIIAVFLYGALTVGSLLGSRYSYLFFL